MLFRLSPQWLYGSSCTWAHDVRFVHHDIRIMMYRLCINRTSCAQMDELPQSHCCDNWEGTLFS